MEVAYLSILTIVVAGILWIISIRLLLKWKHFRLFLVINGILVLTYSYYLMYGSPSLIGHDEYGLQRVFYLLLFPILHIVVCFFIALGIRKQLNNRQE